MADVKNTPPGQSGNPGTPKEKQQNDPDREHGGMGGSGRDNPDKERDKSSGKPNSDPNRERSGGSGGGQGGNKGH
ncbi:MAG TPA: hypothetical protein VJO52_00735 [Gemmatimonadaceae bacterium]|nr:hypothetical protein [Gemmatimonadaceae bacterium]